MRQEATALESRVRSLALHSRASGGSPSAGCTEPARGIPVASFLALALACGGRAIDGVGDGLGGSPTGAARGGAEAGIDPEASGSAGSGPLGSERPGAGGGRAGASSSNGGSADGPASSTGGNGAGASGAGDGNDEPEMVRPDEQCPRDPISLSETVEVLANAAAAEAPADRPFIRFVSGGAYRTTCSAPTRSVVRVRRAVNKLVNSLSIEALAVTTRPLDASALLLRLDLRDYGWDRPIEVDGIAYPDGWSAIVAHTPLALEFVGGDASVLKQQVEADVPWLLASSFVAAASSGELYYALTGAPATLAELKAGLGITVAEDLPGGSWQRAGFGTSGISSQGRGVARYTGTALGAGLFWQTFDYAPTSDTSALFLDPLGARADATEVLYSLPNGLPGYFSADAAGRRVTEAALVLDPARGGPPRVMASCGSCHNGGLIVFDDAVRSFVEANVAGTFTPDEVQAVRDAYPEPGVMSAYVEADGERLQRALEQAGLPGDTPDPISRIALDYERVIDRDVVAGELYVRPDAAELDRLPPALAAAVSANGLARATFEASYLEALCAVQDGPIVPVGCP